MKRRENISLGAAGSDGSHNAVQPQAMGVLTGEPRRELPDWSKSRYQSIGDLTHTEQREKADTELAQ